MEVGAALVAPTRSGDSVLTHPAGPLWDFDGEFLKWSPLFTIRCTFRSGDAILSGRTRAMAPSASLLGGRSRC